MRLTFTLSPVPGTDWIQVIGIVTLAVTAAAICFVVFTLFTL